MVEFNVEGSSNYAFNLILRNKDEKLVHELIKLEENGVEYEEGTGGGNQLRQPYLKIVLNCIKILRIQNIFTFIGFILVIFQT